MDPSDKIPFDYSNTSFADFTIRCPDGDLKFSRYILGKYGVFAGMLKFGGKEAAENVLESQFSRATMNTLLNHIDPVNGMPIIPADVLELTRAAHQYDITPLLGICKGEILANPRCSYLELTYELFPDLHESLLTILLQKNLLVNVTQEMYLELFQTHDPMVVAVQYLRDGYAYDSKIKFDDTTMRPDDYTTLADMFDDQDMTRKLLGMAVTKWKDDLQIAGAKKVAAFPVDVMTFYKTMVSRFKIYRNSIISPEIEAKARDIYSAHLATGVGVPDSKIIQTAWTIIKGKPDIMRKLRDDYNVCKLMISIIENKR